MKKFDYTVCGGTFDHLHKGHKEFLRYQFDISENVLIGVTGDSFVGEKNSAILPFAIRQKELISFLQKENLLHRAEILEIHSVYIPQKWEHLPIGAIIVTEETKKGAEIINEKRRKENFLELPILVFKMENAEDGLPISSSRIRNGEIDREGKLFIKPDWFSKTLVLPESLRQELAKPFGTIISNFDDVFDASLFNPQKTIAVGDVVVKSLNEKNFGQKISVVDFKTHREKTFSSFAQLGFPVDQKVIRAINPAGEITGELFVIVISVVKQKNSSVIFVEGEEDLAVLPLVLAAPLGFFILYGQPDAGVVKVEINEENKKLARDFVSRFQSRTRGS